MPFQKLKIISRKKSVIVTAILIIAVASYLTVTEVRTAKSETPNYLTETISRGSLVSSITGTGQVAALNQVDVKPKVTGDIVQIYLKTGQEVKIGDLLVQIDSRDALAQVKNALTNLETAKLELEEFLAPPDAYTLLQAENTLTDAKDSLAKLKRNQENELKQTEEDIEKSKDDLNMAYEDSFNDISSVFLDLPDIMTGLKNILLSSNYNPNQWNIDYYDISAENYSAQVYASYQKARPMYEATLAQYKNSNRYSSQDAIVALLNETYETAKIISDTVKNAINLIDDYESEMRKRKLEIPALCNTHQSDLNSYLSQTNSRLSNLLSSQRSLKDSQENLVDLEKTLTELKIDQPQALVQAERGLREKEQKIVDLKSGPTDLELRNKNLAISQKQNDLLDARQSLADYSVRAPFSGQLAAVNIAKGDSVSSGTTIGTLITNQKIAEITLNEIDVADVAVGQKVVLDFDAIENLSITGQVAEIDALGTVSQGVVSYNVRISFDVDDARVKPGMSVTANIITSSKQNVLLAPISAVKTQAGTSYVEILAGGNPQTQTVVTGSSNDTMIEILEGLSEGDKVITQTITAGSSQSPTNSSPGQRQNQNQMQGMMRIMR